MRPVFLKRRFYLLSATNNGLHLSTWREYYDPRQSIKNCGSLSSKVLYSLMCALFVYASFMFSTCILNNGDRGRLCTEGEMAIRRFDVKIYPTVLSTGLSQVLWSSDSLHGSSTGLFLRDCGICIVALLYLNVHIL